jgi:hypothetical protein
VFLLLEKLLQSITPEMKTMMTAQKPFRKKNTVFYCIYLCRKMTGFEL